MGAPQAHIDNWEIPEGLFDSLQAWAQEPDRWIGGGSLELLARQGHLHKRTDLLTDVLGLKRIDDKWDLGDQALSEWAPYFIGMLYHYYPDSFLPAVVSIIARSRWHSVAQVIQWLIAANGNTDTKGMPVAIRNALIQRVREKQSTSYAEPESFQVLGNLAPSALVGEPWDDMWQSWLPDSRVALANALGKADLDSQDRDAAISFLKRLISDGNFAVRRAAYRGLASQSMKALYTECLAWAARGTTLQLRQRAAEAYAWLDPQHSNVHPSDIEKLRQTLFTDPERIVRETAERAWSVSRERRWAKQYLEKVMAIEEQANNEVLDLWPYGDALTRTGDDECIQMLRQHVTNGEQLPNIKYWYQRIIQGMEKSWRKTTRNWPEPWFAWEGTILEGHGRAYFAEGKPIEVEYSIWRLPATEPSGRHSWGGALWPVPFLRGQEIEYIELENRNKGEINVTNALSERVIFHGTGPYPT